MTAPILEIALATPLYRVFDYLPPKGLSGSDLQPGIRLQVPFGRRQAIGVLVAIKNDSELPRQKLRAAAAVLDTEPVLSPPLIELCRWAAAYYIYPLGEALLFALPPPLRKGKPVAAKTRRGWRLSPRGLGLAADAFKRAPRQQQVLDHLLQAQAVFPPQLEALGLSREAVRSLQKKEWLEQFDAQAGDELGSATIMPGPQLSGEQSRAVAAIAEGLGRFHPCLLNGITGSGKTEVYLGAIEMALQRGAQALVLVPEIGLTPQTLARFEQRFPGAVVAMHSAIADGGRLDAWRASREGSAHIVIGTRSAIFAPFKALGLIIVDEEHDTSYKQQEGFRFSARDVAVKRAQLEAIPVIMGSATASAESLYNASQGRYTALALHKRAGNAQPPSYQLVDLRGQELQEGFSAEALLAMEQSISQRSQVLVYLNRRGYAPALICHSCGWVAACPHCDARMVVHRGARQLKCHHCEAQSPLPQRCLACDGSQLVGVGQGTERSEAFLQSRFPGTPVLRIDRDTTRNKGSMDQMLAQIHGGDAAILVGTQMLAKGHHFPQVTLVTVLDADAGLCSSDFRGPERTAQVLMQVAGRAGRAERPGRVLIQSHQPEHPLLLGLVQDNYAQLSEQIIAERRALQLPPFGFLGAIRSDAAEANSAEQLLQQLRQFLGAEAGGPSCIGPLPPPIARRAGRYRSQLLFKHHQRGPLHTTLMRAMEWLQANANPHKLRWSIDIDPQDFI